MLQLRACGAERYGLRPRPLHRHVLDDVGTRLHANHLCLCPLPIGQQGKHVLPRLELCECGWGLRQRRVASGGNGVMLGTPHTHTHSHTQTLTLAPTLTLTLTLGQKTGPMDGVPLEPHHASDPESDAYHPPITISLPISV